MEKLLKSLKIRPNSLGNSSNQSLFEDPVRNGLLLYQILQELSINPMKKPHDPVKSLNECRGNLLISLETLTKYPMKLKNLLWRIAESIMRGNMVFLEKLLIFIQNNRNPRVLNNFPIDFDVFLEDFSSNYLQTLINSQEKEEDLITWLKELGLYEKKPLSWDQTANDIIKGDILYRIYEVFTEIKIRPIHRNPQNEASCLANLRKFLNLLRKNKRFPQKFLWMESEIIKGKKEILLGFIEDLRTGFEIILYEGNNDKNNEMTINKRKNEELSEGFKERSMKGRLVLEIPMKYNEYQREKMHSLLSEREGKARTIEEKRENHKKNEDKWNPIEEKEVLTWLEALGFKKIAMELKQKDDFWLEFQDGFIRIFLGRIIEKLEEGTQFKIDEKPKTKASCIRNIKEVLKPIRSRKEINLEDMMNFEEEGIFEARKGQIIKVLLRMKEIFEERRRFQGKRDTIIGKYEHFFDRLTKNYILKGGERRKMLVFPKYIDDDH